MSSFEVISPILLITMCGYFLRKLKKINRNSLDSLIKLVFDFIIPILLFKSTAFSKLSGLLYLKVTRQIVPVFE